MFPLPVHLYFEAGALLTSVICRSGIRRGRLRWFPLFLLFIVIVEFTGRYLRKELLVASNAPLYNFSVPIEYLFYLLLFAGVYEKERLKKGAYLFACLFFFFCCITLLISGISQFNNAILLTGNISIIAACCIYFYELLVAEKKINLIQEPMFWISSGLLLFNMGEFLYSAFYKLLRQHGWDKGTLLFKSINNQLILALYTCITIGLICEKIYRGSNKMYER